MDAKTISDLAKDKGTDAIFRSRPKSIYGCSSKKEEKPIQFVILSTWYYSIGIVFMRIRFHIFIRIHQILIYVSHIHQAPLLQ